MLPLTLGQFFFPFYCNLLVYFILLQLLPFILTIAVNYLLILISSKIYNFAKIYPLSKTTLCAKDTLFEKVSLSKSSPLCKSVFLQNWPVSTILLAVPFDLLNKQFLCTNNVTCCHICDIDGFRNILSCAISLLVDVT